METFKLDIKPFSVNQMYGAKKFRTVAYTNWIQELLSCLSTSDNLLKLKTLRESFDIKKHYYSVELLVFYPRNVFINKKGEISTKTQDCSNFEKSLIDVLFLPKYFETVENLNIDDKYIAELLSKKMASEDGSQYIEVSIEIKTLQDL